MEMPKIGLGTWRLQGAECTAVVAEAIGLGYRHVDTAQMYGNEAETGEGVLASGVAREEIFVVTKIHQDRFADGTALDAARRSIDAMGVGAADLILCHWPPRTVEPEAVMDALMAVQDDGLTRAIGISNFNVSQMERAAACGPVLTNQVEFHPMLDQARILAAANRLGTSLTAYMPIVRGEALTLPGVVAVAEETGRDPASVVIHWVVQQGVTALCKSSRLDRLLGNLEALDFELSDAQMARIGESTGANRRLSDMEDWAPDWDG